MALTKSYESPILLIGEYAKTYMLGYGNMYVILCISDIFPVLRSIGRVGPPARDVALELAKRPIAISGYGLVHVHVPQLRVQKKRGGTKFSRPCGVGRGTFFKVD